MPHSSEISTDAKKNEPAPDYPLFRRHCFRHSAVRHLAWLTLAPPMLNPSDSLTTGLPWPDDTQERLMALDQDPSPLQAALDQSKSRRLGHYFEQLYGFALEALLPASVVAHSLPVRDGGRTLGELDFLVSMDGRVEHHEIAVKFYLGWTPQTEGERQAAWYGPDTRDRLDAKLEKLRTHQVLLARHPATRRMLDDRGLEPPVAQSISLFGYLFEHRQLASPVLPEGINPNHETGEWCRLDEARAWLHPDPQTRWIPLFKPHWLGPCQRTSLDASTAQNECNDAFERIEQREHPMLFAAMVPSESGGFWVESRRCFVTPDGWPGQA